MRQITSKIAEAFHNRQALKIYNTMTDGTILWLNGNKIAQWEQDGIWITTAGFNTQTTRERLNGLFGVGVNTSRGQLLLNGHPWDGGWVNVNYHNELHEGSPMIVEAAEDFDVTSEYFNIGYSRPLYEVFETLDRNELIKVDNMLKSEGINAKKIQSKSVDRNKAKYFLSAKPDDRLKALSIIQNL
jgi:hypothetical protein